MKILTTARIFHCRSTTTFIITNTTTTSTPSPPYPHHHFIVHNDMFHQQNHLYLPAGSFKLLSPPPFSPTDHFFWVSCNDKRKKEEEKEKMIDEIDDKMYELPDLQDKS